MPEGFGMGAWLPSKRRWQDVVDSPRSGAKSLACPDRAKPRLIRVGAERETGKTAGTMPQELGLMCPFPKWDWRSRLEGGSTGPGARPVVSCGSDGRGRRAYRPAPWSQFKEDSTVRVDGCARFVLQPCASPLPQRRLRPVCPCGESRGRICRPQSMGVRREPKARRS